MPMTDPLSKARSLLESGALRDAATELAELADEIRLSPRGVLIVGRIAEALQVRVVARTAYLRARRAPGTRRAALLGLVSVALDLDRPMRADQYLEELLVDAGEERVAALALQVRVRCALGRFASAAEILAECRDLAAPEDSRPTIARAQLLRFQDRRREAHQILTEAIEAHPEDADLRLALADLCWINSDLPGAIEALRFVIQRRPEDYRLRVAIGDCHASLESWPAAAGAYRKALAVSVEADSAPRVRRALALALERRGDPEKALEQYRQLVDERDRELVELARRRIAALERGSEGDAPSRHVISRCRPRVQTRDGSAIASLSILLARWGKNLLPTRLRRELGATPSPHRVVDLLREEGLHTRAFRATFESLRACVEADIPVLLVTERHSIRHYLVVAGYDPITETLLARDPVSPEWTELSEARLEEVSAPEGWRAIVAVLKSESDRLQERRLDDLEIHEQILDAERRFDSDPEDDEALEIFEQLAERGWLGGLGSRLLADACARRGEWERAFSVLEAACGRYPGDSGLERRIVQVLAAFGEHGTAVDVATQMLTFRPHAGDLVYLRARSSLESGQVEAAYRDLRRAIRQGPDCAERFGLLGRLCFELGDPDTALQWYDIAIEIDPSYAWAHTQRGDLLLDRGDLDGARSAFETAVSADPAAPAAQVRLGRLLAERATDPDQAEACFRRAISDSYDDAWAWLELGRLQQEQGQWEAARESFVSALDRDPQSAAALIRLGQICHEATDEPELAEIYYRRGIELDDEDPWVFAQLGRLLQSSLDRPGEAVPVYKRALDLDPSLGWVAAQLGHLYETAFQRADLAEQHYRHALEQSPEDAWTWMRLGRLAEAEHQDLDAAGQCYQQAESLEPENPWPRAERARVAVEAGRPAEAISIYERLLELVPEDRWVLFRLSELFVEVGHVAQAVRSLEQLVKLDPAGVSGRRNLALAYERVGRAEEALEQWDQYLELRIAADGHDEAALRAVRAHVESLQQPSRQHWWSKGRKKKQRGKRRRSSGREQSEEAGG